jgi:hypothetical protein
VAKWLNLALRQAQKCVLVAQPYLVFQFAEQSMVVVTQRFLLMQMIRGKSDGRWFRRLKASSLVSVDSSIWGFANNFLVNG